MTDMGRATVATPEYCHANFASVRDLAHKVVIKDLWRRFVHISEPLVL